MERFARLYAELDATNATSQKVAALKRYLASAPPADAAWAVYFLAGGKPRQAVPVPLLRRIAVEQAGIADWLFEACYQSVGDLAETIALVLPEPGVTSERSLAEWVEQRLLPLRGLSPAEQTERVAACWRELDAAGRFLFVKLIGGAFRVGVSRLLVQRALAELSGLDAQLLAQRMIGYTDLRALPTPERYLALLAPADAAQDQAADGRPYPFFLAHALAHEPQRLAELLGPPADWLLEWKYDGIRGQVVKRAGRVSVWSRGEELLTERLPEIVAIGQRLPDGTVLDGEIVAWDAAGLAPFARLQQRIARKQLTRKVLAEAPVRFIAYDLLQLHAEDLRRRPTAERRARLECLLDALRAGGPVFELSPRLEAGDWTAAAALRDSARERGAEGLMLKQLAGAYGAGRTRTDGTWWKWKLEPYRVDAVLVYAQRGHGRRAGLYTDYTFAVWNRRPASAAEAQAAVDAIARREPAAPDALQLVVFAKAYSGLGDAEFARVDRVIRGSTLEKFGPVRTLKPTLVFEIGFEGLQRSGRHKSGIALRFPRMLRIRDDKPLHEADTLATLQALLPP